MQQPLALLTKNATIFWEHEVFIDSCQQQQHGNLYFFCIFFKKSSKKCENNAKNISFNLGFINKYLFYHPYVTMPNVSLNLV